MSETPQTAPVEDQSEQPLFHDTIVRLENEATEYLVPLKEALQGASRGELELLFQRPPLFPRTVLRPLGRELVIGEPNIMRTPDYLVLLQESCLQLLDRPSALVTHTHSGYRSRSGNSFVAQMRACDADKSEFSPVQVEGKDFVAPETKFGFWGSWALWSDAGPVQYTVRPEDVFVRTGEFKRWRRQSFYPRAKKSAARDRSGQISEENSLLDAEMSDDHKSPALILMCEAAFVHWAHESVVFDNPATFPSDDAVAMWLIDHSEPGTFSRTSAKDAARLIKPPFASRLKVTGN